MAKLTKRAKVAHEKVDRTVPKPIDDALALVKELAILLQKDFIQD